MENAKKQEKKDWIKLVNVLSCIAVVFLHTNGCFWNFSTERYWFTANIIECVFYFAVPCFFMISGATLLDYRERYSLKTYFEKRIKKALIPYVIWSTVGIVYSIARGSVSVSQLSPSFIWDAYINSKAVSIYWFFPVLFGLYMTIPLLSAIDKDERKDLFTFVSLALFITIGVIPLVLKVMGTSILWNGSLNVQVGGYVFYLLVGYLIARYDISPHNRSFLYLLALFGLFLHIYGTYTLSVEAGEIVDFYKGYINAPCMLYSVGIAVWCKYNAEKVFRMRIAKKVVDLVNNYTLSIYLLQFFIYSAALQLFDINTKSIVYRLGAPLAIIPLAMIITYVIRKVPVLRRALP